jgi:hypothetical protein
LTDPEGMKQHLRAQAYMGNDEMATVERSIRLTEPLQGSDGAFMRGITEMRPALIVVDSRASGIPWLRWEQILKTSAATRRIPIIALLDREAARLEDMAASAGVEETLDFDATRGELAACTGVWALTIDPRALGCACEGKVSSLALEEASGC